LSPGRAARSDPSLAGCSESALALFFDLSKHLRLDEHISLFELLLPLLPIIGPMLFVKGREEYRALSRPERAQGARPPAGRD
jgi:hypothetical protein